jgi:hypothetical protein
LRHLRLVLWLFVLSSSWQLWVGEKDEEVVAALHFVCRKLRDYDVRVCPLLLAPDSLQCIPDEMWSSKKPIVSSRMSLSLTSSFLPAAESATAAHSSEASAHPGTEAVPVQQDSVMSSLMAALTPTQSLVASSVQSWAHVYRPSVSKVQSPVLSRPPPPSMAVPVPSTKAVSSPVNIKKGHPLPCVLGGLTPSRPCVAGEHSRLAFPPRRIASSQSSSFTQARRGPSSCGPQSFV